MTERPTLGAGAVVHDDAGRLLVIQRGRSPAKGRWTLPGGRVEFGERADETVVREVAEETGLNVTVDRLVGHFDVITADYHLVILDFEASIVAGELRPGDDAADARWVTRAELEKLPLTDGLLDYLDDHGVGPRI